MLKIEVDNKEDMLDNAFDKANLYPYNPNIDEPMPIETIQSRVVLPFVIDDLRMRSAVGIKRYGKPLSTHNGRSALRDAYDEVLDLAVYFRQLMLELGIKPNGEIKNGNENEN